MSRRLLAVLLPLLAVVSLPPSAGAATWDTVHAALAPWPALQKPDGAFPDYAHGGAAGRVGGYDEEQLGYALLLNGLRTGDQAQLDAAFRAFAWAIGQGPVVNIPGEQGRSSAFANAAITAAYNVARESLPHDPRFAALRAGWENHLRQIIPPHLGGSSYGNKYMVDAVAVLELLRTGLRSDVPGSVLADPARWRAQAKALINRKVPQLARRYTTNVDGRAATVLSDPPKNPIAYQGLTLGYLARAIDLLGDSASKDARRLLVSLAEGSAQLTGPDGDLSYTGRSQQQAWTLTLTAYGALTAARYSQASRGRFMALAERALNRLHLHAGGPTQFAITPNLVTAPAPDQLGLDSYASTAAYTGLSMTGAMWALQARSALPARARASSLSADRNGFSLLSPGPSMFATVRRSNNWFAVRADPVTDGDVRMDFGLMAWKVREGSQWTDALPIRPITHDHGTAGPLLLRGGQAAVPYGDSIGVTRRGVVGVEDGGWQAAGRRVRRTPFFFIPGNRRLRMEFRVRAGDLIRYSLFLPAASGITPTATGLTSSRLHAVSNAPSALTVDGSYASGREHGLTRATMEFSVRRSGTFKLTLIRP